jgi:hydrogenase maturation protease
MPTPDTLVLCIGNPSRGDDAAGPRVSAMLAALPALGSHMTLMEDIQLQPEHVEDMAGHRRCIIVDAALDPPWPPALVRIDTPLQPGAFSHAVSPAQLAWLFRQRFGGQPLQLFTLGIPAREFELGQPPTAAVLSATEAAVAFLTDLLQRHAEPATHA